MSFRVPEQFRVLEYSSKEIGNNGLFEMHGPCGIALRVVASDGLGWEHVSVSVYKMKRLPNWREMCFVKDLFWDEEDCVIQFHPPKSDYVNNFEVLHMWREIGVNYKTPPSILIGLKT